MDEFFIIIIKHFDHTQCCRYTVHHSIYSYTLTDPFIKYTVLVLAQTDFSLQRLVQLLQVCGDHLSPVNSFS